MTRPTEKANANTPPAGLLASLEAIANLVRALTTPVIAIVVAVAFYDPLVQIVRLLPEKFRDADKFSAAGLTLEIQKTATAQGNPQLAQLLGELSRPTLRYLLKISDRDGRGFLSWNPAPTFRLYLPVQSQVSAAEELQRRGLYDCDKPIATWWKGLESLLEPLGDPHMRAFKLKVPREGGPPDSASEFDNVCRLSDTGRLAYELIVEAVAQQIAPAKGRREGRGESQ